MKPRVWQLQTAKNKFSELVHKAQTGEPQLVTKNGKAAVYVIDCETFDRKLGDSVQDKKQVILQRPHKDLELEIARDSSDTGRKVGL
jgi:prevent-host-death family protein